MDCPARYVSKPGLGIVAVRVVYVNCSDGIQLAVKSYRVLGNGARGTVDGWKCVISERDSQGDFTGSCRHTFFGDFQDRPQRAVVKWIVH